MYEFLPQVAQELQQVKVESIAFIKLIWKFHLWPFIMPVPVDIEVQKVSYFKRPVNGKVEACRTDYAGTFIIQTILLKISRLLHKSGSVDSQLLPTALQKQSCR